jgi:hypothetical protein
VKPHFIIFIGGPEKEQWIKENRLRGIYKIGLVQGPQTSNNGSWKMIHLGKIDQGFTVCVCVDTYMYKMFEIWVNVNTVCPYIT